MIYLVTTQLQLYENVFKIITVEESLQIIESFNVIQYDSETSGLDARLCTVLCAQFGNKEKNIQVVVDCTTIDLKLYKNLLETKYIIGHNLKFDIQFLYNYNIIPTKVYDTMIVEQLLYLGYPAGSILFNLQDVALRRLDIYIDKSIRGQIIWQGLTADVITYAANDVVYLEDIMNAQIKKCKEKNCLIAAKLECDFITAISYLEWCGIHLDADKWSAKMLKDKENLEKSKKDLDNFVINTEALKSFIYKELQGSLFDGFDADYKVNINWSSSRQVVEVAKILGFNTNVQDKKTGENKDSVLEKHLKGQKGINDTFLKLYFNYQEYAKVVSSFGQGHLNAINPKTCRLHTVYKQLGASSGRLSCGSKKSNESLAKFKGLSPKDCSYVNIQQLPNNTETRGAFTAPEGYLCVSCDYSSEEARLAGDIYQDEAILKMFREGIDSHSMYAKIFFKDDLKDIDVNDIKKLRPDLRQLAKGPEFALNFGGGISSIIQSINCTEEEANQIIKNYEEGFKGTIEFAKKGSKAVRSLGYVLINPITGHKMYWWDHKEWVERQKSFTSEFWEEYRLYHKNTGDSIAQMVKTHFKAASKYDRMARNSPCQGTAAIILKEAMTNLFRWIVDNNYFGKIEISAAVHDELVLIFPKELDFVPNILKDIMEKAASKYCKSLPIPAEPAVGDHWIH